MKQTNKAECLRLTYSAEQSFMHEIIRARKRSRKLLVETKNIPNLRIRATDLFFIKFSEISILCSARPKLSFHEINIEFYLLFMFAQAIKNASLVFRG